MKSTITIAVQCHNFQRRLCWMLSSLVQQTTRERIKVIIDCVGANGIPTTESVVGHFSNNEGLNVEMCAWPDESQFKFRGIVRNRQIQKASTEWFMFGDCDMVYDPDYFDDLMTNLDSHHSRHRGLLSSGRMSNVKEDCTRMVNSEVFSEAVTIKSAFAKANSLNLHKRSNVGAGFSQIFSVKHGAHAGKYVDKCRDWDWAVNGANPRSDIQFRKRMHADGAPRISLPERFTTGAIHLNHNRDPETRTHLVEQR